MADKTNNAVKLTGNGVAWLGYGLSIVIGVGLVLSLYRDTRHPWSNAALPQGMSTTQTSIAGGAQLFQQNCSVCHGNKADGNGIAANVLDPKPRDFHVGKYRIVTSGNGVPFRDDVIRTIRHGMPGTSMPGWLHLTEPELASLADYVMSVSHDSLKESLRIKLYSKSKLKPDVLEKKLNKSTDDRLKPEDPVQPGAEPAFTAADVIQARAMFTQTCAVCHGTDGKGMQNPEWRTDEGLPIASRNLRSGVFKGGGRGMDIYTRIYAGIPGTPMPAFNTLNNADIWRLVHFVQALAVPDGVEPEILKSTVIAQPATQPTARLSTKLQEVP